MQTRTRRLMILKNKATDSRKIYCISNSIISHLFCVVNILWKIYSAKLQVLRSKKEATNTNVREYLDSKHLPVVWMQEQLKQRGYDVDLSHLCRILKGQRCSERALQIVEEAKAICAKYESL